MSLPKIPAIILKHKKSGVLRLHAKQAIHKGIALQSFFAKLAEQNA